MSGLRAKELNTPLKYLFHAQGVVRLPLYALSRAVLAPGLILPLIWFGCRWFALVLLPMVDFLSMLLLLGLVRSPS
jgi:hypothetical protein